MAAVKSTFKANEILPLKMELTSGTWYTLWAPVWISRGEQWQAFLGDDNKIFVFSSPAELLAAIEQGGSNVLTDHPAWQRFRSDAAKRLLPDKLQEISLIELPNQLADRPSYTCVRDVNRGFILLRSLGGVADVKEVNDWFASYSILNNTKRGAEHYSGEIGLGEWTGVGRIVLDNWASLLDSVEPHLSTPQIDAEKVAAAQDQLKAAEEEAAAARKAEADKASAAVEADNSAADPYDNTIWARAGIDPIRIVMAGKRVYTLRCYVGSKPRFLGKHGQINTFPNAKAMVRWLVDSSDHDLEELSTWGEITNAANAGELEVAVHESNEYSFTGLREDIGKGIDAVDTNQLGRAYELLADAADWAEDDSVNKTLIAYPQLQSYISYMLGQPSGVTPTSPFTQEVEGWTALEQGLIRRFTKF